MHLFSNVPFQGYQNSVRGRDACGIHTDSIKSIPLFIGRPVSGSHNWKLPKQEKKDFEEIEGIINLDFNETLKFIRECKLHHGGFNPLSKTTEYGVWFFASDNQLTNILDGMMIGIKPLEIDLNKPALRVRASGMGDGTPRPNTELDTVSAFTLDVSDST